MNENRNENINKPTSERLTGIKRAIPILFSALAVFLAVCYMTKNTGVIGAALSSFMLGLFSYGAYAVPLLLFLHAIFFRDDVNENKVLSRAIFSVMTVLLISILDYAIGYWWVEPPFVPTELYVSASKGGFIGSILAFLLIKAIGHVGLIILVASILLVYVTFFFARDDSPARRLILGILGALADAAAYVERAIKRAAKGGNDSDKAPTKGEDERVKELANDDFFAVDNGMRELAIDKLGIKETRDDEASFRLQESVQHKSDVGNTADEEMKQERSRPDFSYADAVYEEKNALPSGDIIVESENIRKLAPSRVAEASAEDIFTKEFDPYDFVAAEAELSKQNNLRARSEVHSGVTKYEKPLRDVSYEDAERLRREAEFEKRKRELVEKARQEAEARAEAARIINGPTSQATEPEFEIVTDEPKITAAEESFEIVIEKTESTVLDEVFEIVAEEPHNTASPDAKKTVEFSFGDSSTPPTEDSGVSFTFGKPDAAPDDTEEAAAVIAERIFASNPAYARSMNPMSTHTTVREDTDVAEPSDAEYSEYEVLDSETVTCETITETAQAEEPMPTFKPYEPVTEEPISNETAAADEEILFTERSMVNPEPIYESEPEDEDEEKAFDTSDDRDEIFGSIEEDGNEDEDEPLPIPPEEQNPDVIKMREQFPSLFNFEDEKESEESEEAEVIESETIEPEIIKDEPLEDEVTAAEIIEAEVIEPEVKEAEPETLTVPEPIPVKEVIKEEKPKPKRPDYSNYQYPPLDLLTVGEDTADEHIQEEIQENADRLIDTLSSFNVTASIKGYDRGPRITRYEIVPAKGVKVSSVLSLQDDIALNLAAESIRMEAPIPGKSAVGVEIPNKKSSTVRLRELLETEDFAASKSKTTVCMGKDVAGLPIIADIAKMPHALIAGATGMGKSVCINSLMISMLYKARPDEVKFIMIDPKQVEFTMYNGIPHLLVPIVNDVKQAAGTLMWAVEEMERRYNMLQEACVRNIDGYNEKVAQNPALGEPLPRIVIVIDEFAELIMQVKNPVESLVIRIAQKARAAGIHLIIGTQKPVKEVITGLIKSNIPTKMSCKVLSNRDSILIFDQSGAEKLLDKGDMLISFAASPKPQRVQCAFVSDGEVEAVMEYLKQFSSGEGYDETVMEDIRRAADKCTRKGGGDSDDDGGDESSGEGYLNDKQFLDAVEVALSMGKISTSLIQRKISVGYGKAAKFIDVMEDMGIVSEPNGQKPRDVLMTKDEWREKLSRVTYD